MDKETYRGIIGAHFRAFESHDFSNAQFSTQIEFLTPISGITTKKREEVDGSTGVSSDGSPQ